MDPNNREVVVYWVGGGRVCEGVVYLTLPGRPTDIGLHLGIRLAIIVADKGRGGMFLFLLFLHFHSCSSFFPVTLFHLLYYLFCLFSLFSGRHKMTHKGWTVGKPQLNQLLLSCNNPKH